MKKEKPGFGLTFYIFLVIIIFIMDIPLPKGVVVSFLYIIPIAGISKTGNKKQIIMLTGLISLFLITGYILSPEWTESEYFAVWNRIIGLITLWIFTFFLIQRSESAKELNESKKKFESIIDTAMDGIMVIDENQRILLFNKACENIFLTPASEARGQSIERFIPRRYHEPHSENFKKFGEENHLRRMMEQHGFITGVKSNGEEFPIEASVSQFEIDGKKYYTVVHRDITDRKKAEEALKQSEEKFSIAFRSNPNALVLSRLDDGTILEVNDTFLDIFGYERTEVIGFNSISLNMYVDPMDRNKLRSLLELDGRIKDLEVQIKTKYGEKRIVLLSSEFVKVGSGRLILTTIQDITDRKLAEEALRESEAKLLEAQKLAHMGSYLVDINSGTIEVSDEFYNIFEIERSKDNLDFGGILNRVHPDDLQNVKNAYEDAIEKKIMYEFEFKIITPSDKVKHLVAYTKILVDNSKQQGKIFGTILDITESKLTRIKLQETLTELQRSNRDLEQFAYIASHDLQEPIRMVKSYTELLNIKYKSKLDEDALEYLGFISEGSERMHQLVSDLLKYSRINTKTNPFEKIDCNEILADVLSDLKFTLQETEAIIEPGKLPVIYGDRTQIRQVFQNLIQNGIKFRTGKKPKIEVCCEKKKKTWLFSVKDNGIGIDKEHLERIFVIFQRLHTREEYPGTGIGLAIVKKIIERHGGVVYVESEIGKGSVFYFTIPIS